MKDENGAEITVTKTILPPASKTEMQLLIDDMAAIKAKLGII